MSILFLIDGDSELCVDEVKQTVTVHIKYGSVEETFSGSVEEVWLSLNKFFSEFIPSFSVAKKLLLSVDVKKLAEECEGLIGFSKEGANLLVSKDKLTDNETLMLWLLANYVGNSLGLVSESAVSKEELQAKLGKSGKITSTRLGELVKSDMIMKIGDDKFRITIFGVMQMQKDIISRIKVKVSS
jgi:hypothetical protein